MEVGVGCSTHSQTNGRASGHSHCLLLSPQVPTADQTWWGQSWEARASSVSQPLGRIAGGHTRAPIWYVVAWPAALEPGKLYDTACSTCPQPVPVCPLTVPSLSLACPQPVPCLSLACLRPAVPIKTLLALGVMAPRDGHLHLHPGAVDKHVHLHEVGSIPRQATMNAQGAQGCHGLRPVPVRDPMR